MYYTFSPDNLIDISRPARTDIYKIAKKSGDLKRGQVLGLVTSTPSSEGEKATVGTLKPCVSTSEDGSQVPFAVLAEDLAEDTANDMPASVFIEGTFNSKQLIFGGSDTAATHKAAAKNANLYFTDFVEQE